MDDRDKELHKFLKELDKYDLVHFAPADGAYGAMLTPGLQTYAVNSDEAEEIGDTLLENAISFLEACKNRNEDAIASLAKKLEGSIELQATVDIISEKVAQDLIHQLQDVANSSKWGKDGQAKSANDH